MQAPAKVPLEPARPAPPNLCCNPQLAWRQGSSPLVQVQHTAQLVGKVARSGAQPGRRRAVRWHWCALQQTPCPFHGPQHVRARDEGTGIALLQKVAAALRLATAERRPLHCRVNALLQTVRRPAALGLESSERGMG